MKVTKAVGKELSPRLHELLTIVHSKRPLLEYEESGSNRNAEVCEVTVWQDGQRIGLIDAEYRRYSPSKGFHEIWYSVTCDNIRKRRGHSRNSKYNKDAKGAARAVIELFTKKPLETLGESLIKNVKANMSNMHQNLTYRYNSLISFSTNALVTYFTELYEGNNPEPPKSIYDQIVTKDVISKKEDMKVVNNVYEHFLKNNGYAVSVMQDESILFVPLDNPKATAKYASTYDLPVFVQEKFTMLKVLEANQFAADIGVRYVQDDGDNRDTIYFVVGGETKVV